MEDELLSRRGKIMRVDHAETRSYRENALFFEQCQSWAINRLNNQIIYLEQRLHAGLPDKFDVRLTWRDIIKGMVNR